MGICEQLGFTALNATGGRGQSCVIRWHKQSGLELRQSRVLLDLRAALATFLLQCMDIWIES